VLESVKKTGKILLASDACERGSFLKDLPEHTEMAFESSMPRGGGGFAANWITRPITENGSFPSPTGSSMPSMNG